MIIMDRAFIKIMDGMEDVDRADYASIIGI